MGAGSVMDGTLAESQAQAAAIWRIREGVTEALQRRGGSLLDLMGRFWGY
jgi:D-2-hydroxyglutarate dehydrogenase